MNSSTIIQQKIIKNFGKEAYLNNTLNRKYIANIVFKEKEKLQTLNSIVHPEVKKHFQDFVKQNRNKAYIVYENAILFESKSYLICDVIITVFTSLEVRIDRIIKRDKSSRLEAENRIKNQWLEEKKTIQSNYLIENYHLDETESQVQRIHNILTKK